MSACARFRALLERALAGPRGRVEAGELAWHEHLLGCGDCRELLQREEALEELLATLPEPHLAPELARRVLKALASARLDSLLELDSQRAIPSGLAGRVRAGVAGARVDARLDALLDRIPTPLVPDGLSARVLAGLARERGAVTPILRPVWRRAAALAAAAAIVFFVWAGLVRDEPTVDLAQGSFDVAPPAAGLAPITGFAADFDDEELLQSLDVLENWDLLMSSDVDWLLAEIEVIDEALLLDAVEEKG